MKRALICSALILLGACGKVDEEGLTQWCHNTVAARYAGTDEARFKAAPALQACILDPDNRRKFSHSWPL